MLTISAVTIVLLYGVIWSSQIFVLIPSYILYLTVAGLVIAPWILWRAMEQQPFMARRLQMLQIPRSISARRLAVSFFIYVVFFALTGVIMWLLVQGLGSGVWDFGTLGTIAVAYTAAWFLGTITPGASGGIGVREAALVFLLGGIIGEADAVTLAVAMRVLTISGDGLYFTTSLFGPAPSFGSPETRSEEN